MLWIISFRNTLTLLICKKICNILWLNIIGTSLFKICTIQWIWSHSRPLWNVISWKLFSVESMLLSKFFFLIFNQSYICTCFIESTIPHRCADTNSISYHWRVICSLWSFRPSSNWSAFHPTVYILHWFPALADNLIASFFTRQAHFLPSITPPLNSFTESLVISTSRAPINTTLYMQQTRAPAQPRPLPSLCNVNLPTCFFAACSQAGRREVPVCLCFPGQHFESRGEKSGVGVGLSSCAFLLHPTAPRTLSPEFLHPPDVPPALTMGRPGPPVLLGNPTFPTLCYFSRSPVDRKTQPPFNFL